MTDHTLGAICLGPNGNSQGGHYFMCLSTGGRITRDRWTDLPMTREVIQWVTEMGHQQGMPATLTFADSDEIFPLPPKIKIPTLHIVRYTCQFEQYLSHRQNECRAHPSWAPTKEPTVSCWRYTPAPKQDRFQDLLEAICPDFLHTTLSK